MRRWMRRRKKGKSGERKGAWLPSYVKTGETHLSSFQVNRMRTPITLVHLGRRSTYFRQIGRNGVGFSIDRAGTLTTGDEILPGGFSSSLDPAPPTRTPRSFDRAGSFIYSFAQVEYVPRAGQIYHRFLLQRKSVITFFFSYRI